MFAKIALVVSLAATALAYKVDSPSASKGWTNSGPQTLTWERVNTDRQNFTVVLVNQQQTPAYSQVLAALVNGSQSTTTLNPPSNGWPAIGGGYVVNLVQDADDTNAILAQSGQFNITAPSTTASNSVVVTKTQGGSTFTAPASTPTGSSDTPTTSDTSGVPNGNANGALSSASAQAGLMVAFTALGFVLA